MIKKWKIQSLCKLLNGVEGRRGVLACAPTCFSSPTETETPAASRAPDALQHARRAQRLRRAEARWAALAAREAASMARILWRGVYAKKEAVSSPECRVLGDWDILAQTFFAPAPADLRAALSASVTA